VVGVDTFTISKLSMGIEPTFTYSRIALIDNLVAGNSYLVTTQSVKYKQFDDMYNNSLMQSDMGKDFYLGNKSFGGDDYDQCPYLSIGEYTLNNKPFCSISETKENVKQITYKNIEETGSILDYDFVRLEDFSPTCYHFDLRKKPFPDVIGKLVKKKYVQFIQNLRSCVDNEDTILLVRNDNCSMLTSSDRFDLGNGYQYWVEYVVKPNEGFVIHNMKWNSDSSILTSYGGPVFSKDNKSERFNFYSFGNAIWYKLVELNSAKGGSNNALINLIYNKYVNKK